MKPKENRGNKAGTYDECQTPPYALEPLYPYLNIEQHIWECAVGYGTLAIALMSRGYKVVGSDIEHDFLQIKNSVGDVIITNPPYSLKYPWLEKCFELGKPFALLLPIEVLGAKRAQEMFKNKDIRIMFMSPRVDFLMRYALWAGHGAQFPTAWFTWKLPLPKEMNYAVLNKPKRKELATYWREHLGEVAFQVLIKRNFKEWLKEVMEYE